MGILKQLSYIFTKKQKRTIFFLLIAIVIGAFLELLGITAVLPFINVAMDPQIVFESDFLIFCYNLLDMKSPTTFLAIMAFALIFIYVIKNVYLTIMNYAIFRFTYNNQRSLSLQLLKSYLKQPYTFFLKNNSADLIRNVNVDTSMLFDSVLSVMQLLVECIVCALLLGYLMILDKSITLCVGAVLIIFLLLMMRSLKKNIQIRGECVRESRAGMSKWLLQTFGGIKEIKIMEREDYFKKQFDGQYEKFATNHCVYQTLSYLPKPAMETVCIASVLLVVAAKLLSGVRAEYFVTTISIFAVAAFRLLPAFNRITGYVSRIMFNKSGVDAVFHDLKEVEELEKTGIIKNQSKDTLSFTKEIRIQNITFQYPEVSDYVLRDASLMIPKNKSVAFVGPSGAGKTTLADIILGVLTPQNGEITVDGKNVEGCMNVWHEKLGYIPQTIYMLDDTVLNNIAFAIPKGEINEERVWEVLEEAQLKDFVMGLEDGLNTMIGEQGVRLSGGQRQRIGIARALYSNPEVLILDEATSALDTDTETAVMEAIDSLAGKKTLIIIAHRLTTIKNCDIIYEIKDEKVTVKNK